MDRAGFRYIPDRRDSDFEIGCENGGRSQKVKKTKGKRPFHNKIISIKKSICKLYFACSNGYPYTI